MIAFREATSADIPLLRHWDQQPHVIASDPECWDWESDFKRNDPAVQKYMVELDGRPLGFIQIMDPQLEQTHYWEEVGKGYRAIDIWIGEESDLNKGYGTTMMQMAIEKCFEIPEVHTVLIDPLVTNLAAHRFYRRLGFQFVEERELGGDDCFVLELKKQHWRN